MNRFLILILGLFLCTGFENSQKLICKQVRVSFYSNAPLENIEAHTNNGLAVWDLSGNRIAFSVLVKGFEFKKALMQKHFNENYLETDKYPKSEFRGKIDNASGINLKTDGVYTVQVSGTLNLHGVTKTIIVPANIRVANNIVQADALFKIALADYNIQIPSIVKDNISKTVEVRVVVPRFENR